MLVYQIHAHMRDGPTLPNANRVDAVATRSGIHPAGYFATAGVFAAVASGTHARAVRRIAILSARA